MLRWYVNDADKEDWWSSVKNLKFIMLRYSTSPTRYNLYIDLSFQRTSCVNVFDIPYCIIKTWVIISLCITVYLHENSVYFAGFEADQSLRIYCFDVWNFTVLCINQNWNYRCSIFDCDEAYFFMFCFILSTVIISVFLFYDILYYDIFVKKCIDFK